MAPRSEVELASGQTLERRHLHRLHVCILIVCSHALWRLNGESRAFVCILHLIAKMCGANRSVNSGFSGKVSTFQAGFPLFTK
jgi:hypothetical protein